jgi:hypothetical protein
LLVPRTDPECGGDGGSDHLRFADGDEIDEPGAAGKLVGQIAYDGEREPSLTNPSRSDRGHLSVRLQGLGERAALLVSTDERGQR